MNDITPTNTMPTFAQQLLTAVAQKGLTALATLLTGAGVIAPTQETQLVSLGLSVVLWAASFAWSYAHEAHGHARLVAATNAPPPVVPVRP